MSPSSSLTPTNAPPQRQGAFMRVALFNGLYAAKMDFCRLGNGGSKDRSQYYAAEKFGNEVGHENTLYQQE